MKKVISLLLMLTLVFSLAACNSNDTDGDKKEAKKEEKVTIKYANWNLGTEEDNNTERQMIKAFEEKYPNIHVEIDESIDTKKWVESLSAAASAGSMPDVFMLSSVAQAVANDWVLDVTDITANDEDFTNVPQVVKDQVTYSGKLLALPVAQNFFGYFVNKDLFNNANLDYPEYGISIDEFTNAVKSISNMNEGVAGLNNPFSIPDYYPSVANENLGWFTYNDGKYQLDSKEFINGVNLASSFITNNYTYETLSDEQKAKFKGEDPNQVWIQNGIALKWDGTWAIPGISDTVDFDWDFIGVPGGRTIVVNDFMGISKTSEHAEEAYKFVKWMSFGKEGFLKRMELADKAGVPLNTLPITTDEEVLDKYFETLDVPGVRMAYENLDNALFEAFKTVPGYADSRWNAPTGVKIGETANATIGNIIDAAVKGQVKIEDYAKQLNELANQKYDEANKLVNQ